VISYTPQAIKGLLLGLMFKDRLDNKGQLTDQQMSYVMKKLNELFGLGSDEFEDFDFVRKARVEYKKCLRKQ
jgi:hypothetical protein